MLKMVEDGHAEPAIAGPRLNELAAERRKLEEAVANEPINKVIEIFPNAAERYAAIVAEIHKALANGKTGDLEAVALVRALIRRIVVRSTPAPQPLEIEVEGTLAILMKNEDGSIPSGIVRCMPPQPILIILTTMYSKLRPLSPRFGSVKRLNLEAAVDHRGLAFLRRRLNLLV